MASWCRSRSSCRGGAVIEHSLDLEWHRLTHRQAEVLERVRARASEGLRTHTDDVLDLIDGRDRGRSARSTLEQLTGKGLLSAETQSGPQGRRRTYQPTKQRSATQFEVMLPDSLINEIKQAAINNGQTVNQWCLELFEAALPLTDSTPF